MIKSFFVMLPRTNGDYHGREWNTVKGKRSYKLLIPLTVNVRAIIKYPYSINFTTFSPLNRTITAIKTADSIFTRD